MNCAEFNGLLNALLDGELSDGQRRDMEAHGRACPECAEALRQTMQLKALFAEMEPEVEVPLQAQAKWRGAVREEVRRRAHKRTLRWIGTAAAAVVVLAGAGWAMSLRNAPDRSAEAKMLAVNEAAVVTEEAYGAKAMAPAMDAEAPAEMAVGGAIIEADGAMYDEAVASEAAEMDAGEVEYDEAEALEDIEATAAPMCAALALRSPACEFTIRVEDVDTACARVSDLAVEYDAQADVQQLENGGANVYVELSAEDAEAFLAAVAPMDASGQEQELPEPEGEGSALVLLVIEAL